MPSGIELDHNWIYNFLGELYAAVDTDGNEAAVRLIVKSFKSLIRQRDFEFCDRLYELVEPRKLPPEVLFAFYSMSNLVKQKLSSRSASIERAKKVLRERNSEEYAQDLFDGIE